MATLEQENSVRSELKASLDSLAKLKAADLARRDLGPELNFELGIIFFTRTLHLFHALAEADLDGVSYQRLVQLRDQARASLERFVRIQNFRLGSYASNPIGQRDQFINDVRDSYDAVFEAAAPVIAYTIRRGTDFEKLEAEAKEILDRLSQSSAEHEEKLKKSTEIAEQMVESVRRIVQEAGVSQHFIHFKNEAESSEKQAKPWLYTTIGIAVAAVVAGSLILWRYLYDIPKLHPKAFRSRFRRF
jgi:ElaB/YqjD/DUF883 family membrane-anchored ribosome-binding protein